MPKRYQHNILNTFIVILLALAFNACKSKKIIQYKISEDNLLKDTIMAKCTLRYKTVKTIEKNIADNEFQYQWITAKASVSFSSNAETNEFDITIKGKKDSLYLVTITALGIIDIARLMLTKDSVKMVLYPKNSYFKGSYNIINQFLHIDIDFDMIQASLFGNSADFSENDKFIPFINRDNCTYYLSTIRKRKLKRFQKGLDSLKKPLQTMIIDPSNFKILTNTFTEAGEARSYKAIYDNFIKVNNNFVSHDVQIVISAQKLIQVNVHYTKITNVEPLNLRLNIPSNYTPMLPQ